MANRKKEVYKPKPMTEGKRNLIQGLLQEYDIQSAEDIQDALKDLLSGTIQDMLETEMDDHLGYDRYERSGEPNYRNGMKSKTVRSKYGEFQVDVPQDRQSSFEPQILPKISFGSKSLAPEKGTFLFACVPFAEIVIVVTVVPQNVQIGFLGKRRTDSVVVKPVLMRIQSVQNTSSRGTTQRSNSTRIDKVCAFSRKFVVIGTFYRIVAVKQLMILHYKNDVFHLLSLHIRREGFPSLLMSNIYKRNIVTLFNLPIVQHGFH